MSVGEAPTLLPRGTDGRPRWQRMVAPAAVAGGLLAATVALHVRDPHAAGSWGMCPSAALGFWCPGCGGLRAVNDLSNAQVADAASSNLLFVASLPLIAYAFWRWSAGRFTGRAWRPSAATGNVVAAGLVVAMAVFTVLRNLPAGSWLAP
ncbi:DUF2752 domain-containing protein [Nocardioides panacisoli]|uniref:DUF2752 domain-containing protein n=1 Tax=Nocardioides panacisoli TaxID=627624 RepID=UPI001C63A73A|nr:DUF2752 domain-containing protein [Nocardioides panacisoli]QYJ04765.1 DUF2752 domain-containing protein [Nocardioides panacisoli]